MAKFSMVVSADFGPEFVSTDIRQQLHKRQANLRSCKPRAAQSRDAMVSVVEFEVPDVEMTRQQFMEWALECCRGGYGGPPFVLAVDDLPDDYTVDDDLVGVE